MKEALDLIDQIIQEHRIAFKRFKKLDGMFGDAVAISGIDTAKDAFMPGRLDLGKGLQKFLESLNTIDQGLLAHFNREETVLLHVFERYGDKKLVSDLKALLLQHGGIRDRLTHAKKQVTELISGRLARHRWEASAHDMRAHISHTRQLLLEHTAIEQPLFITIRKRILAGTAEKE